MPQKDFVGIKLETATLIAIDTRARNQNISRSDFIRNAIDAQLNKIRLEEKAKREGSDLQKVYQALTELNVLNFERLNKLNENLKLIFNRAGRIEELLKNAKAK